MNVTEQENPPVSKTAGKVLAAAGICAIICCVGILCYSATLMLIVEKNIFAIQTPTLDLACEDTNCLNVCVQRIPDFEIALLFENRDDLASAPGGYELARYKLDEQDGQLKNVATPSVPEYLKAYQADTQLHQRIWSYFTGLFPEDSELHASYMIVYIDSSEDRHAASIRELDGKWRLYVNLLHFNSPEAVLAILTHEYGHMLTLNKTQTQNITNEYGRDRDRTGFDKMEAACNGRFFTGFYCMKENAYLNDFGNRFWTGEVYESWVDAFLLLDDDAELYKTAIDEFYSKHSDQFVREYAATNPVEDIADSWTEFILRPKPSGTTIADQKVLFFYEYPELVQMRRGIIQGVCQSAVDQK